MSVVAGAFGTLLASWGVDVFAQTTPALIASPRNNYGALGNLPTHEHGAHMELVVDDGSPDWDALQTRAQSGPVFLHA